MSSPGEYTDTYNIHYATAPGVSLPPTPNSKVKAGDYDFSSGGWALLNRGGALTLPHDTSNSTPPEATVALGGISARYIGIEILTAGDGTGTGRVGLSQVEVTAAVGPGGSPGMVLSIR